VVNVAAMKCVCNVVSRIATFVGEAEVLTDIFEDVLKMFEDVRAVFTPFNSNCL